MPTDAHKGGSGRYVRVYLDNTQSLALDTMIKMRGEMGDNTSLSSVLKDAFDEHALAQGVYYDVPFGTKTRRKVHTAEEMGVKQEKEKPQGEEWAEAIAASQEGRPRRKGRRLGRS